MEVLGADPYARSSEQFRGWGDEFPKLLDDLVKRSMSRHSNYVLVKNLELFDANMLVLRGLTKLLPTASDSSRLTDIQEFERRVAVAIRHFEDARTGLLREVAEPGLAIASERAAMVEHPLSLLTADNFATKLQITEDEVRAAEADGKIFSVQRDDGDRGYPAFQAWASIQGEPLARVMHALDRPGGAAAYLFFAGTTDLLYDLTPIEVLCGALTSKRPISPRASDLLSSPEADRLQAVVSVAHAQGVALQA